MNISKIVEELNYKLVTLSSALMVREEDNYFVVKLIHTNMIESYEVTPDEEFVEFVTLHFDANKVKINWSSDKRKFWIGE